MLGVRDSEGVLAACMRADACMQMEELVLRIQTHAYHRALVIAHERRATIEAVAEELLSNADATVAGARLDELLAQPPATVPEDVIAELPFQNLIPAEVCLLKTSHDK